jgi:hypothetical protein
MVRYQYLKARFRYLRHRPPRYLEDANSKTEKPFDILP